MDKKNQSNVEKTSMALINSIDKLIIYGENPSKENKNAYLKSQKEYGEISGDREAHGIEKGRERLNLMFEKNNLEEWRAVERTCLRISDNKELRNRLLAIAEKFGVGKIKWVLE